MSDRFMDGFPDLVLRRLHANDIDATREVLSRAFGSARLGMSVAEQLTVHCSDGFDQLPLEQQTRTPQPCEYWIVTQNNAEGASRVIGIGGLYRSYWVWEKSVWLGWFAVDPDFQGKGIGAAMLTALMRLARAKGNEIIKVETGQGSEATNFYKKMGFVEEAILSKYYSPTLNGLILSRDLLDLEPDRASS